LKPLSGDFASGIRHSPSLPRGMRLLPGKGLRWLPDCPICYSYSAHFKAFPQCLAPCLQQQPERSSAIAVCMGELC
jgi:hypothetical protein